MEERGQMGQELSREASYFQHNQQTLCVQMRERGWPTGSAMMESAAKQLKEGSVGQG